MSTVTKYFCDRCKTCLVFKEIQRLALNDYGFMIPIAREGSYKERETWDLCLKCTNEVIKFIGKDKK